MASDSILGLAVSTVDIYDVITSTWTSTGSGIGRLSVARFSLASAAASNQVIFAGGECV